MKVFAKETITPIALNIGDQFDFVLKNKVEVSFKIGQTTFKEIERVPGRGLIYEFSGELIIDGVLVKLERFVSCQQAFYVPFVINGIRIWFNDVGRIFDHLVIRDTDKRSLPNTDIRLALQDASLDICPEKIVNWYRSDIPYLLIENCYAGDDCWLGVYKGEGCHGGLDINMQRGIDLITPISLDHQFLAHSVVKGFNNNRWKGRRDWGNGDTWYLWSSHLINLTVDEEIPLEIGTPYAKAAGVWVGRHDHSHFEFWIDNADKGEIYLDSWILFWQIFENMRKDSQELVPRIAFESTVHLNEEIKLSSQESFNLQERDQLLWSFGDGCSSLENNPSHVYLNPGVYEVVLTILRGEETKSTAVYIIVKGEIEKTKTVALPVYCYGFENYRNPFLIHIKVKNEKRTKTIEMPFDMKGDAFKLQKAMEGVSVKEILKGKIILEIDGNVFPKGNTLLPFISQNDPKIVFLLSVNKNLNSGNKLFYDVRDPNVYLDRNAWFAHRFAEESKLTPKEYYVTNGEKTNQGIIEFNLNINKGKYQVFLNKNLSIKCSFQLNFEIISGGEVSSHTAAINEDGFLGEFHFASDYENQLIILNNINSNRIVISNLTLISVA